MNASATDQPRSFTDLTREEFERWCRDNGLPAYRARQIWHGVYRQAAAAYADVGTLPLAVRTRLADQLPLHASRVITIYTSADRSEKRVLKLADDETVETVWIPMGTHATVCVSSQVGCPIQCVFCASGMAGVARNLSAAEIIEQILHAASAHPRNEINNLVFMGMGEPLLNWTHVARAIGILNDPHGMCIGARRMTVSTVGVPQGIVRLASDTPQVNLAVSLHAADDELRRRLIPHCPSNVKELMDALRQYYAITHRRITFEYVLLRDVNDSTRDAQALVDLLRRLPCKVNVIPYNTVPGCAFATPAPARVHAFVEYLCARHITAVARRRKGDDIAAACGQLRRRLNSYPSYDVYL